MSLKADSDFLRSLPIFRDCDPVPLQILSFAAERQEFASGEDIITQGKKARAAYVILDGKAKMRDGAREIGVAESGALLGEMAMLRSGPYSITATAAVSVETLRISNELVIRLAKEYPDFGEKILQNLSDRLGHNIRELENVRALMHKSRSFSDLQ